MRASLNGRCGYACHQLRSKLKAHISDQNADHMSVIVHDTGHPFHLPSQIVEYGWVLYMCYSIVQRLTGEARKTLTGVMTSNLKQGGLRNVVTCVLVWRRASVRKNRVARNPYAHDVSFYYTSFVYLLQVLFSHLHTGITQANLRRFDVPTARNGPLAIHFLYIPAHHVKAHGVA